MTNPTEPTHAHKPSAYSEKLKDPRWQKKRLEVFERDKWKCRGCGADKTTLHVHHLVYEKGKEPWDYDIKELMTLCESCHELEREERSDAEHFLLLELKKKGFLCYDIAVFSDMLHDMSCPIPPYESWTMRSGCIEIQLTRLNAIEGEKE